MQKIAELISNGLSVVTVVMALSVVVYWYSAAKDTLKNNRLWTAESYFILGVFFGFIGESLDNLYWIMPWSASFLDLPIKENLINAGVYFNIPFRQGLGILAAYFHVRSALQYTHSDSTKANTIIFLAALAGLSYSCLLVFSAQ